MKARVLIGVAVAASLLLAACPDWVVGSGETPFGESSHYLAFNKRNYVELQKTRGLIDLNGSFTIEAWVRWDDANYKAMYLMGDEVWPKLIDAVPVSRPSGWVLRTGPVEDADKRYLDFTIGASASGRSDWFEVRTAPKRIPDSKTWHHIAVCKSPEYIALFWNGKRVAIRPCRGVQFHACPTNIYLGVRKDGYTDRQLDGDFKGFRISTKTRYSKDFTPPPAFASDESTAVLLYFNSRLDSEVPDLSGKGRNGLIVGPKWYELREKD